MLDGSKGRNEWLSENGYRAFPFEDDSLFVADDGVEMPLSLVRDFRCVWIPRARQTGSGGPHSVRLKSFFTTRNRNNSSKFDVEVCLELLSSNPDGASTATFSAKAIEAGGFMPAQSSIEEPSDGLRGCAYSRIVLGVPLNFSDIVSSVSGMHTFSNGPRILMSRVVYIPGGVGMDSLSVQYGNCRDIRGVVHVKDGKNTRFYIKGGELFLEVGGGIGEGYDCPEVENDCLNLHFINGQRAGSDGDFQIVGGPGISIGTGSYSGVPGVTVTTSSIVNEFSMPRKAIGK